MVPTLGGVYKIQILIRDLLKENLQKIFGEEMGGSGGPRPPYQKRIDKENDHLFLICSRVRFPKKKLGLDSIFTSWDLESRIPRRKLPI